MKTDSQSISILNEPEIWKDIPYFPLYQISNLGNVRNIKTLRVLKLSNVDGYKMISIINKEGRTTKTVHRLVASSFIGISDLDVNHIDGDKSNNVVSNLEYAKTIDNVNHALILSGKDDIGVRRRATGYSAYTKVKGKQIVIGFFKTFDEAKTAYWEWIVKTHGDVKYNLCYGQ